MFFNRKKKIEDMSNKETEFVFIDIGLDELIEYIKGLSGVDLEQKKSVLSKRIRLFCEQKRICSFEDLLYKIKRDNEVLQQILNLITVNETYFYREFPQLTEAVSYIRGLNRSVKVLCAPCASGEEVYSLMILAQSFGLRDRNIDILGIDINSEVIHEAKKGVFSKRSLHKLDNSLINRYFKQDDKKYHIKKELFYGLEFKVVNIFDDDFLKLGKFDIIFSRNMMIYFNNEYKLKTIKRFHGLLNSGGRLYTGHADLVPQTSYFEKIIKDRLYFYEKKENFTR